MSAPLFSPPTASASLYRGQVMHARLKPFGHRFAYRVFSLLLDLDRLDEAGRLSALFSIGRFNLLSFKLSDHGPRDGGNLRAHAETLLAAEGVATPARILLLCYPRILGYTFNPLSVYYCYDAHDELTAVIYEVRNTIGGMHPYVKPVTAGMLDAAGLRQEQAKSFYVSPFLDMDLRYRFRMRPPGEVVAIRILESDRQGPILAATFHGERQEVTTANLLRACLAFPFLTLKIFAAILWQALKLWLKGAQYRPAPPAPAKAFALGREHDGVTR
jgi:DUF1365 family protein